MATNSPLDRYFSSTDAKEQHTVIVRAPAALVFDVAAQFDVQSLWSVRMIFALREKMMGAKRVGRERNGLLTDMQNLGWGCLDHRPGELFVGGAACQPWNANVRFSPLSAESFHSFCQPDHVKIAWTLEVLELGAARSRLVTETRAVATDAEARRKFLRYWRWARFGIIPIRWFLFGAVRRQAERLSRRNVVRSEVSES